VCTHFISQIYFIKVFSQVLFLFLEIAEMGRIPLWYYSCLRKLWEYHPSFIKVFVDFIFYKTPLGHDHLFNANQPKRIPRICVCVCAYLNLKIYLKVSLSTPIMYPRSHYKLKFIFCLLEIDPFQYLESN
jgi:hypothetical protein